MRKFKDFLDNEASGGIILIVSAIIALIVANLNVTAELYKHFLHFPVTLQVGSLGFDLHFEHFVNDALMAIFFLLVAIEIKHEVLHGQLSSFKKASFPFFGAVGGMIVPAAIYFLLNFSHPTLVHGWAIPMATDIAFAIGVLSLLGDKVPSEIKVFLLALAVIDDLGAILVIALFYTSDLSIFWLLTGSVVTLSLFVLNLKNVRSLTPYTVLAIILWYCFLKSGIHATIAGVIVGFMLPNRDIRGRNLAHECEKYFSSTVKWIIVPIFAFVNSGVSFDNLSSGLFDNLPVVFGIFLGLFVGKPVGIFLVTYVASKLHLTEKPKNIDWNLFFLVGIICGIGFTMSIFITNLSFPGVTEVDKVHVSIARLSILVTSTIAAIVGLIMMNYATDKHRIKVNLARRLKEERLEREEAEEKIEELEEEIEALSSKEQKELLHKLEKKDDESGHENKEHHHKEHHHEHHHQDDKHQEHKH